MASFQYDSGRQFETDPTTGQIFFREPIDGAYSPWRALEPSSYHMPRPASRNMFASGGPYPTPLTQDHPGPYAPSRAPPTRQALPNVRGRQTLRTVQRSARAHNPTRGQGIGPHEGGRGQGRTRGAVNYRPREIEVLLDLVEAELPVGAKGWGTVGAKFREWAATTENSSRTDRSLEAKYKQFVRTRKPTGDAECPPEIERAHEINDKIQAKVSCRDLGDDEIADFKDSDADMSDDADDEAPVPLAHRPKPTRRVRTTRKESALAPTRQPSARGFDFLDKITQSLDPEHQAQRDTERTSVLFQSQQLILLHAQIRDLNQLVQALRTQLDDSEQRRVDADRRADRLQNQIDIASVVNRVQVQQPVARPPYREPPVAIDLSESCAGTPNPDQDRRWEATYRNGGQTSWSGNGHRLNSDDDVVEVVEVNPIPWSPSLRSPARSPSPSDSD